MISSDYDFFYNQAALVKIISIFTWDTGSRFCLSIDWWEEASCGAALHSTQERTQVAHWNLFNERSPIFTKIPPLKYLWQKGSFKFTRRQNVAIDIIGTSVVTFSLHSTSAKCFVAIITINWWNFWLVNICYFSSLPYHTLVSVHHIHHMLFFSVSK